MPATTSKAIQARQEQLLEGTANEAFKYLGERGVALSGPEVRAFGEFFIHILYDDAKVFRAYFDGKARRAARLVVDAYLRDRGKERKLFAFQEAVAEAAARLAEPLSKMRDGVAIDANTDAVVIVARGAAARTAAELFSMFTWPGSVTGVKQ